MNHFFKYCSLFIIILHFWPWHEILAQSLSPTLYSNNGGFHKNQSSLTWSMGEPVIQTFSEDTLWLTQGFQQSKLEVSSEDTLVHVNSNQSPLQLSVYPNPVGKLLSLDIHSDQPKQIQIKIYDTGGVMRMKKVLHTKRNCVDFSQLPPGIYFLHARVQDRTKVYKIIRHE